MRRILLALLPIAIIACGGAPRPRWACEAHPRLYPSVNGFVPMCPWDVEPHGCDVLEDYDGNGVFNVEDLEAFCREQHDGDSLTLDTERPGDTSTWCYTCD